MTLILNQTEKQINVLCFIPSPHTLPCFIGHFFIKSEYVFGNVKGKFVEENYLRHQVASAPFLLITS